MLLLLLLVGGVLVTDLLAYLPIGFLSMLHLPRWFAWAGLIALVASLMGDGPKGPTPRSPE